MIAVGWRHFCLLLVVLLGFYSTSVAADSLSYNVNGFGTLGLSFSDSDSLGFIRDYQQKESVEKGSIAWLADSSLGVQFNVRYSNVSAVLQVLARERLDSDPYRLLNYAYIDVQLGDGFTVRVGKNPLEMYLSSDNRSVGYSLLPAHPVSEFYTMLFEESYPGIDFSYRVRFDEGILTLEGFTGTFSASLLAENPDSEDFRYDPMVGLVVKYNKEKTLVSFGYLWGNVTDPAPILKDQLYPSLRLLESYGISEAGDFAEMARLDDVPVHYFIAGASTQAGDWTFKGEANYFLFDKIGNTRMLSAYLQAGYAIGEWTPYIIFAGGHTKKERIEIPAASLESLPEEAVFIAGMANSFYKRLAFNQVSVNLGVRWDLRRNMAVKTQWGYYHVQGGGILLWNALDNRAYDGGDVNIVSACLDFIF